MVYYFKADRGENFSIATEAAIISGTGRLIISFRIPKVYVTHAAHHVD